MTIGKMFTPREAADLTGFHVLKILRLIKAGKLAAKNVSAGSRQPRWLIRECDLDEFFCPPQALKREKAERRAKQPACDAHIDRRFTYGD